MTPHTMLLPNRRKTRATQWLDVECSDLVRDFWAAAGGEEPFPRTLELALGFALPVTLVRLPELHTDTARTWLRARQRDLLLTEPSRPLHGCLIAWRGNGIIFLDASDSAAEQRFSLAHETAHFLVDYMLPRRRALATMGEGFSAVLDGERSATVGERLASIFQGLSMRPHVNLMQRSVAGSDALSVWQVEHRADRVALALLAPPELVHEMAQGDTLQAQRCAAENALMHDFGLPPIPAQRYAAELLQLQKPGDLWQDGLRALVRTHAAEPAEDS